MNKQEGTPMASVFDQMLDRNRHKLDALAGGGGGRSQVSPLSPSAAGSQDAPAAMANTKRASGTVAGLPFSFAVGE